MPAFPGHPSLKGPWKGHKNHRTKLLVTFSMCPFISANLPKVHFKMRGTNCKIGHIFAIFSWIAEFSSGICQDRRKLNFQPQFYRNCETVKWKNEERKIEVLRTPNLGLNEPSSQGLSEYLTHLNFRSPLIFAQIFAKISGSENRTLFLTWRSMAAPR